MVRLLFHVTGINHNLAALPRTEECFDTFYIMLITSDNVGERGACTHSSQSVRCMRRGLDRVSAWETDTSIQLFVVPLQTQTDLYNPSAQQHTFYLLSVALRLIPANICQDIGFIFTIQEVNVINNVISITVRSHVFAEKLCSFLKNVF